jgi:hypothetical protein
MQLISNPVLLEDARRDSRGSRGVDVFERSKTLNEDLVASQSRVRVYGPWLLVCECGSSECTETIELTAMEHEAVRSHPRLIAVACDHTPAHARLVTTVADRFLLVELV